MNCHPMNTIQYQKLNAELKDLKSENEARATGLHDCKVVLKDKERYLEEIQPKTVSVVQELRSMEQECKLTCPEKDPCITHPEKSVLPQLQEKGKTERCLETALVCSSAACGSSFEIGLRVLVMGQNAKFRADRCWRKMVGL